NAVKRGNGSGMVARLGKQRGGTHARQNWICTVAVCLELLKSCLRLFGAPLARKCQGLRIGVAGIVGARLGPIVVANPSSRADHDRNRTANNERAKALPQSFRLILA